MTATVFESVYLRLAFIEAQQGILTKKTLMLGETLRFWSSDVPLSVQIFQSAFKNNYGYYDKQF